MTSDLGSGLCVGCVRRRQASLDLKRTTDLSGLLDHKSLQCIRPGGRWHSWVLAYSTKSAGEPDLGVRLISHIRFATTVMLYASYLTAHQESGDLPVFHRHGAPQGCAIAHLDCQSHRICRIGKDDIGYGIGERVLSEKGSEVILTSAVIVPNRKKNLTIRQRQRRIRLFRVHCVKEGFYDGLWIRSRSKNAGRFRRCCGGCGRGLGGG